MLVGATGLLGAEILRALRDRGREVRALLRASSDPGKRQTVFASGAEIVEGDLKAPASLRAACRGVSIVVSTASATRSRQPGDSIASVDEDGHLALVDSAAEAGVRHFVFVSFPPVSVDYALQRAKRRVEERIRASGMSFTILQPVKFCEVWLSPDLDFVPRRGRETVRVLGDAAVSWISARDVARFAAAATEEGPLAGRVLPLGGPEALSPLQVIRLFEELGAPKAILQPVTKAQCEERLAAAKSPLEEAFAAAMLSCVAGQVVDPDPATALLPGRLATVRDHAIRTLSTESELNRSLTNGGKA